MNCSWRKTWPLMAAVMAFLSTAHAEQGAPSLCDLHPIIRAGVFKTFGLTNCREISGPLSIIKMEGNDFSELKPSDFEGLSAVTWLFITGDPKNLKPMDLRILGKLPNLQQLTLENIDLSKAPKKFLADLKQLKRVALINCKLSEFPEFGAEPIPFLNLSHNKIKILPKDLPVGLPLDQGGNGVMDWKLNGNQISDISSHIEALASALALDISENLIAPLPCDKQTALLQFKNNLYLRKELTIDTKSINMDSSCDLSKFISLGFLQLNGGSANDFSRGFGTALWYRSELVFSNFAASNELSSIIDQGAGQTMRFINSDLTDLDFNNPLWKNKKIDVKFEDDSKDFFPSVFNGSTSVVSITIKMPNLHSIPQDMFKELPNLRDLNFRDTPLTETSKATFQGIQVFGLPTNFGVTETGGKSEEWAP